MKDAEFEEGEMGLKKERERVGDCDVRPGG